MYTLLKLQEDPTCEPGVKLIIGISESRGEFPGFDGLVHESVMHLYVLNSSHGLSLYSL